MTDIYTCPFCRHHSTVEAANRRGFAGNLDIENAEGLQRAIVNFVVCSNPDCKRFSLGVTLINSTLIEEAKAQDLDMEEVKKDAVRHFQLIPPSAARVYPDYVPEALRRDYTEACLIVNRSPKASATLARRCLQGVIRDFWKTKPGRLIDEIKEIEDRVDPLTWQAIDAVRSIGDIGVHMEKDVNLIIDTEAHESEALINLIETLIQDWYVNREERKKMLAGIAQIADDEKNQK